MAASMPGTRLVYLADREADIVELMQRAHALGTLADWLIRSQHNRRLPDGASCGRPFLPAYRWAKSNS